MSLSRVTKYITIATDVSVCNEYRISTWACYIRHDGGAIKMSGIFNEFTKNTCTAETKALVNAIVIASRLPGWADSKVIMHNEIERVLTPLRNKKGNLRIKEIDRSEMIITIALPLLDTALGWELRDIKAHYKDWKTSPDRAKYAINRWCDKESRRLLREAREEKKQRVKDMQKADPNKRRVLE